jgi:hypothetical protein
MIEYGVVVRNKAAVNSSELSGKSRGEGEAYGDRLAVA